MNLFQELRQRRVPQIASGYIVGSWGLIQFFDFLESRMAVSHNLVNLVGIGLVLLLPSVVIMAWVHGRPGRDTWGRIPKVLIPANILAIVLMLFFLFRGQDLGAITQTIEVQDEHGVLSERVVPKAQFVRRVLLFYPENIGDAQNDWARETLNVLQGLDLDQDVFVGVVLPTSLPMAMTDAGSDDGHGLTRPHMRKMVKDLHLPYFQTSTINFENGVWIFKSEMHESESGRILASHTTEAGDLFTLADLTSRQIREDLEIPSSHLESNLDLPVMELTSNDLEAVKNLVEGLIAITFDNDWQNAAPLLEGAVERDPGFAMAQYFLFAVYGSLGQNDQAAAALTIAMENHFRVPERTGFLIKSQYYYNVKKDSDKSMAVLKMWSQIYPNDIDAYSMQAAYHLVQQELPEALAAYEKILSLDPSQVVLLRKMADLHHYLGNSEEAEKFYLQYVGEFPSDTKGYRDLAAFYSKGGQLAQARETLEKAQLVDPNELSLVLGLIDLDIKTGRFQESGLALGAELSRAKSAMDRGNVLASQIRLSGLLGQADQLILDMESFHSALLEIQNPLQANLGIAMYLPQVSMVGQPEIALQKLDDIFAEVSPPYDQIVSMSRAWVLATLGRSEEARTNLEAATEVVDMWKIESYRPFLFLIGGMIAEEENDYTTAVSLFRKALDTSLEVVPVHHLRLARALVKNDQMDEARKVMESAMVVNPAYPEYHLEMAMILYDSGKVEKAKEHLAQAQSAWGNAHPGFLPAQRAGELAGRMGN